jgi:putative NIF3 family GTP cyclohydrolase 1 type 2
MRLITNRATALQLLSLATVLAAASAQAQHGAPPTARQIIQRIQSKAGVAPPADTVDTFKSGNPDAPVTGIAVTMMATLDVLERAVAAGDNLVITHEPTFYNHLDKPQGLSEQDAVWKEKRAFIEKHGLVIWRFHDIWHLRSPDGIEQGMIRALGWQRYQNLLNDHLFVIPATTLENLASDLAKKLDAGPIRVVGDPKLKVTKVALSPGSAGFVRETHALQSEEVEVLIAGETREWETVEYVADAVTEGKHKALILLNHIPSEQPGMDECARWIRQFITEVPVHFLAAEQPFWTPPRPM